MSAVNFATKSFVLVLCLIAAGCSVLSPQPDRSKFYVLSSLADGQESTAPAGSPFVIGIGPVSFPDYLRRSAVVTRVAPNRIELSDEKRWAEPLDKNFTRVLSENLATLLDTQRIEKYPWPIAARVDYQVEVDVQQFETTNNGQSQLVAIWIIRDGPSHRILYASKTTTVAAAEDEAGASSALSSDLASLSKDIAARITALAQHHGSGDAESNSRPAL
jgi:uncharacterized lipoprotein YmbA